MNFFFRKTKFPDLYSMKVAGHENGHLAKNHPYMYIIFLPKVVLSAPKMQNVQNFLSMINKIACVELGTLFGIENMLV